MHLFEVYFAAAVLAGTPLMLAGTGELLGEMLGMLNIGVEGLMLIGASSAVVVTVKSQSPEMGLLAGSLIGGLYLLVFYGIPVVGFGTEQVLPGFAVWFIGLGLSQGIGAHYEDIAVRSKSTIVTLPLLDRVPVLKEIVASYPWPVYLAVILPIVVWWFFAMTRHGRNMRAIGEDPVAAAAGGGINVRGWRSLYVFINGCLGGFGGAVLAVIVLGEWGPDAVAGRGFIALAVVLFSAWRPLRIIAGSYIFGLLLILVSLGGALAWPIPSAFLSMVPYMGVIGILVLWAYLSHQRGIGYGPAALGMSLEESK